jgi:cell division topological specificity factor
MGWLRKLVDLVDPPKMQIVESSVADVSASSDLSTARSDAKNRLRLVLMHDRTQLSPVMLERMRDDMVEVISKYVEIDKEALEVNLESDASDTIALVANIPVLRARTVVQ